jgi:hypothetical protein
MGPKERERMAEQWLDAAFKRYGEAEPRPGLEGRVLANLRAAADGRRGRRVWWPAVAAIAALLMVAGATFWASHRGEARKEVTANRGPAVFQVHQSKPNSVAGVIVVPAPHEQRKLARRKEAARLKEAVEPKLDQFPSPRPLSKQEEMLARYVRERPQEARLVAQAQAELMKQDLLEFEKRDSPEPVRDSAR